jgi:shikimate dehydrogenase
MYPENNKFPELPYELLTDKHILYDLIYNPAETVFLKKGREQGATCINGQRMLEIQAEASWKIWTK